METVRKLIMNELNKREGEYDIHDSIPVASINFIGYKNKNNIGRLVISLDQLNINIVSLKERVENVLRENNIEFKCILLEL